MKLKTCALVEVSSRGLNDIHKLILVRESHFLDFYEYVENQGYIITNIHSRGLKKSVYNWHIVTVFANGSSK